MFEGVRWNSTASAFWVALPSPASAWCRAGGRTLPGGIPRKVAMAISGHKRNPFILKPAVAAPSNGFRPLAATACGKIGCHPEGDLRSSWKLYSANLRLGAVAAEPPDLGSSQIRPQGPANTALSAEQRSVEPLDSEANKGQPRAGGNRTAGFRFMALW